MVMLILGNMSTLPAADVPATVSIDSGDNAIHENGHYIVSMLGGGVWCRKCGVFVREPKHRRLKISYRRCTQIDLDRQYWLSSPSFQQNPHRALDLYRTMLEISNGHDLAWNASMSRTVPFGQLRCLSVRSYTQMGFQTQRQVTISHVVLAVPPSAP